MVSAFSNQSARSAAGGTLPFAPIEDDRHV